MGKWLVPYFVFCFYAVLAGAFVARFAWVENHHEGAIPVGAAVYFFLNALHMLSIENRTRS